MYALTETSFYYVNSTLSNVITIFMCTFDLLSFYLIYFYFSLFKIFANLKCTHIILTNAYIVHIVLLFNLIGNNLLLLLLSCYVT